MKQLTANATMQMNRVLQALFIAQANDAMRRLTLDDADSGDVPDMSRWIEVMANATKPILLQQYQQGMARTAAKLGAKVNAVNRDEGLRRYRPGDAIYGTKGITAGRHTSTNGVSRGERRADRPLHFYKSLSRVVVKAAGSGPQKVLVDFDLFDPKVLEAVNRATFAFCRETMDTATVNLKQALVELRQLMREGLPRGDSVAFLAKKVREVFADPMRAFRIATTETSRAMHAGQLDTAEQSGVVTGKTWLASSDACKQCLDLDGKTVKLREPFWVDPKGGPYAVVLYPPLHPHCFCDFTEEIG